MKASFGSVRIFGQKYEKVIMPTPKIIEKIEHEKRKTGAIIHVTC